MKFTLESTNNGKNRLSAYKTIKTIMGTLGTTLGEVSTQIGFIKLQISGVTTPTAVIDTDATSTKTTINESKA